MTFGEKVQSLRKNNNMSQETLANMLRVNRNNLSRVETGKSEPDLSLIKGVATIFNVDANSLIGIEKVEMATEEKVNKITNECKYLLDDDLNLLIRLISVLRKEYVKSDVGSNND